MERKAKIFFIATVFFLLLTGRCSWAVWLDLTEEQMQEAVEYGQDGSKSLSLGSEWAVTTSGLKGWVEIRTPFKILAEFARNNLSRKRFANSELRRILVSNTDTFTFTYYHYKLDDAFTQSPSPTGEYYAFLVAGDKYIYPLRYTTGTQFKEISLDFTFPAEEIDVNSKIRFVFREPSGFQRDFIFDLKNIR